MSLSGVRETIDLLLQRAVEADDSKRHCVAYRHIADYYRLNAELDLSVDERKVVLNTLEAYPDVRIRIRVDEISDDYERVATRNSLQHFTEWAYRYGSKGRPVDEMELPDVGEERDELDAMVYELNDRIQTHEDFTVNDAALALKLASLIADRDDHEELDDAIFESEAYEQVNLLLDEFEEFIQMKDDGRLDWDMMGGTFDSMHDQTQQDLMKESGKRSVLRELRDFDGDSIESFLEQR